MGPMIRGVRVLDGQPFQYMVDIKWTIGTYHTIPAAWKILDHMLSFSY